MPSYPESHPLVPRISSPRTPLYPGSHPVDQCISCAATAVSYQNNQCLSACPQTYYPDNANICRACDVNCLHCVGPLPTDCSQCKTALFQKNQCVAQCPPLSTYSSSTPPVNGSSNVSTVSYCLSCHPECSGGCTGPSASQCTVCVHVSYQSNCVLSCPAMTYQSGKMCLDCNSQCSGGCVGGSISDCVQCKNLQNGASCVSSCAPGQYIYLNTTCLPCHDQCSATIQGCSGPSANACVACASLFDTVTLNCVVACSFSSYRNRSRCLPCASECNGCVGPSTRECLACNNVLDITTCVPSCPHLKYASMTAVCQNCDALCSSSCQDAGPSNCLVTDPLSNGCVSYKKENGGSCVVACDPVLEYAQNWTCSQCAPECLVELSPPCFIFTIIFISSLFYFYNHIYIYAFPTDMYITRDVHYTRCHLYCTTSLRRIYDIL